jgi:HAD superfamily hydrolase (TIGR01459 family)
VSSGEIAYQSLPGRRAFIIGKRGESYGYDGVEMVTDAAQAEVILIVGSNAPETSLDDYRHMLRGLKIPAICCNPDKLMITAHGLQPSSGAIATIYSELGGDVTWIGKPYRAIYDHALELLGHPKSVLCIGDSAEHDVAGGRGAGLSTLLVQQGVSAGVADEKIHPMPDYIMRAFTW